MRAILRFLDLFNPFSVNMSHWHFIVKLLATGVLWFAIGVMIFVPKDRFFTMRGSDLGFHFDGDWYSVTIDGGDGRPADLDYYYAPKYTPFLGTSSPERGLLGLIAGTLATGLIWFPAGRTSKSSEEESSKSSQKTKNEQANEALLVLLDVLSPDERQIIRERLMESVAYQDERIPAGIYEEEKYSSCY
ncbi:MAG: hypothetical protein L0154_27750 [Chloroflexi bacterium]|nr:hypothetical protein [Chloroflexota bacterium]